jgi:general secretion pathway protein G
MGYIIDHIETDVYGFPNVISGLHMIYRCPYCRALFQEAVKRCCPHCNRVILMPGFFKGRPRGEAPEGAARERLPAGRRLAKPASPFALLGNPGFKVAAILLLMMLTGAALVGKVQAPPPDHDARKTDRARLSLANLRVALELYRADCGAYPSATEGLAALVHPPAADSGWKGPYVYELKNDLWGVPFQYRPAETNLTLFGCGPDREPDTADDLWVARSDIAMSRPNGTVHAVIIFRDGSRKIIHEQVTVEPSIRAELIPNAPP